MASPRMRSATPLLLAACFSLYVVAAVGAGLPAWTASGAASGGARRRLAQSVTGGTAPLPRRRLKQYTLPSDQVIPGLSVQVFKPYNSPYTLPIPASAKSSATTTAPNVNYTDASSGGVMALAGGTMTNFALRFTGSIYIPAFAPANYTFYMDSDDGSLLMIDGTVVISDPGAHGFSGNGGKSGTVLLVPGAHDFRIDYVQQTGMAGIVLKYSTAATAYFPAANKAVVPPAWFNYLPAGYLPGLAVQTFVPYNSPYTLPIPGNARPTAVTAAPGVNYPDVGSGGLMTLANATSNFALRFVGVFNLPYIPSPNGQYPSYFIRFTLNSDDGSQLLLPSSGNGPDIFIDDSGKHGFSTAGKTSAELGEGPNPFLLGFELDYSQQAGNSGAVLSFSMRSVNSATYGPTMVIPPSWFAHKMLQTPPPPSPPPPPPPPYQCPLCYSDATKNQQPCCAPKECNPGPADRGGSGCCDEDQDRCGYYNADGQGARCCDNCQYDGSSGDAICCDKGAELCTNFEEPGGCCPAGYTCADPNGEVCCPPGQYACDDAAICCPGSDYHACGSGPNGATVCTHPGPPPPHPPPPPKKPPPPVKH